MNYLSSAFGRVVGSRSMPSWRHSSGFILVLMSLIASAALGQTTYYVAANGNDSNDGRSAGSPVQTLLKVNGLNLQAGDQVLFRRGDTFRGTLNVRKSGSAAQPVIFDAYGSGAEPILSGSMPVTDWNNVGGNVWQATCSSCGSRVTGLYRGGNDLPLGRYPNYSDANKGYLTIQSHQGESQLTSKEGLNVNLNTGWSGTEVVIRATQWITDRYGFNGQSGNTLNLTSPGSRYYIQDNFGFFVQNHPATLDQNGEWAFNTGTKTIQLFSPQGDPDNQSITATTQERCVDLSDVSNVTLRNLRLTESLNTSLYVNNSSNLTFSNLDIIDSGEDGVIVTGSGGNIVLENSTILYANNTGVGLESYANVTLRGNQLRHIGIDPGRGLGGDGQGNGVRIRGGQNMLVENNVIDSIGYNGIAFTTSTTIRRNVISNVCLVKSDGGGIYTWNGNQNAVGKSFIQNNIISRVVGAPEGTPDSEFNEYLGANGIFFDDCAQNAEISGNTVFNCTGLGIFVHEGLNLTLTGNTSFNNGEGQLSLINYVNKCPSRNITIRNNILLGRLPNQFVVKFETSANDLGQFGTFDNNYYMRPFEDVFKVRVAYKPGATQLGADLSLSQWQSQFGQDANTRNSPLTYPTSTLMPTGNVVLNTPFNNDTNGWEVSYSNQGNGRVEWEGSGRLDGGSMRVAFPTPSNQSGSYVLATSNIGAVSNGKTYKFDFDAVGTGSKRVEVFMRQKFGSYSDLASRTNILISSDRQHYTLSFKVTADEPTPILVFQVYEDGQTAWFDNIKLEEAAATVNNPDDFIKLYTNPTAQNLTVSLNGTYRDAKNQAYSGSTTLAPFTSLLLLKDNNTSTPPPSPPPTATLRDPENPANAVSGLDYRCYEGDWSALPDFNSLTPTKTGTTPVPDLSVRSRDDQFGLRFTGYVNVPADGQYTFYTSSDDGSKLLIGSTEVVNNDGAHGPQERSGTIGLKAGRHAITVLYFEGAVSEELIVSYEGPNLGKQIIAASAFYRVGSTPTPTPPPTNTTLREPENPANAVVGLDYRYYEGSWTSLPDFNSLTPVKTGTTGVPDITVRNRDDLFGLRFTGYVNVPADGQYTFYTSSDDGSKLLIGSTEVVSHDGTHAQTEKSGTIGLKAGRHAFTVVYFENGGGEGLSVSYSGPNLNKQVIPASAFYRVGSTPPPSPPPTATLRDPENPANAVSGLDYRCYEGDWSALPDFNSLTPTKTGTTPVPDLSVRSRDDQFGLRFTGYVNVPADGQYTFYTSSDDGSKLLIGSTEVVNNDGAHGPQERSGTIGLKAGRHAITVLYFEGAVSEELIVSYEGPNLGKQIIAASAFYRVGSTPTPTPPPTNTTLREPENPANAVVGLDYRYYEGSWTSLPDFNSLTPVKTGTTGVPDITVRNRDDLFGLRFTGYVNVPADGQYTFYTSSDDGSKLLIGSTEVVSHDGTHAQTEKSGTIGLKAGRHAFTVVYFENGGGEGLSVSYSGPGVSKQVIPASAFYRVGSTTTPTPPPTNTTLREPENPANAVVGLDYRYYEGNWTSLPDFNSLTPVKTGTTGVPDITVRNRDDQFGLRFTGYVNVPADGQYTLYTSSDDGSKLLIGSTEVVSHDGTHAQTEKSGTIGLKAGRHAFTVVYFENGGGEGLSVSYSGPGVSKQVIPASAFYRVGSGNSGTGLRAEYFNNTSLAAPVALSRTDATIDFDWGNGSPGGTVGSDNYSVRWSGQVEVPVTGSYVFSTVSDDGVRLWVNGVQVINNWTTHGPTTDNSPAINLTAGQKYDIRMEYFESSQGAVARLRWSYPGQGVQAVPQSRLYPATGSGRAAAADEAWVEETDRMVVYPVPVRDELTIRYRTAVTGRVQMELLSAGGRSVLKVEEAVERGENRLRVRVRAYPPGLYVLTLTQGGQRISRNVIVSD